MKKIDILREALSKTDKPTDKLKELTDKAPNSITVFGRTLKKSVSNYSNASVLEYSDTNGDLSFNLDVRKPNSTIYIFPSKELMEFGLDTVKKELEQFSTNARALWQAAKETDKEYWKLNKQGKDKEAIAKDKELLALEKQMEALMIKECKEIVEKDISKVFPGHTFTWKAAK